MSGDVNVGEYRFGEFTFDSKDNTLRRDGAVLALTPKALDLLRVFLTNRGRLLSKAELMNELWPDSFVEESNLAVTIRQLRKTLADDAHHPVYIETVARQGYRFVAEVEQSRIPQAGEVGNASERRIRYLIPMAVTAGLLIASISLGSLYLRSGHSQAAPIFSTPFAAEKLSTSGKVFSAVISPDGKKVVYTVRGVAGDSVWLREITSENNVEIIPASGDNYYNLEFSPDGATLYFTRGPRTIEDPADVFSVSVFGGIPKKIVSDTRGWISVSPDGKLLSFVRCSFTDAEYCSLWSANASDGKNQKMVTSRPRPFWIGDHEISPDGKSIVFSAGQSQNAGEEFGLSSVDIHTGVEREITTERFFDIKSLEILPANTGILFTASRSSTRQFRVWKLDYADGSVRPLNKDSDSYFAVSLDETGSRLIATQVSHDFRLVRSDLANPDQKMEITDQVGYFNFGSSGGFVFQSESTGDVEIWKANADGSGHRQLTNVPGDDIAPMASADSSQIFFCSNRSGEMQLWKMKADGSDQRQVTDSDGGMPMFASADWVYYQHGVTRGLWRIPTEGGNAEPLLSKAPYRGRFIFSPSGTRAAYLELRANKPTIVIVSIPDGRELGSLGVVDGKGRFELAWVPDESAIAYTMSTMEGEATTLWIQPIDGRPPRPAGNLGGEEIGMLAFGQDTNSIAFIQGGWKHDVVMLSGLQ